MKIMKKITLFVFLFLIGILSLNAALPTRAPLYWTMYDILRDRGGDMDNGGQGYITNDEWYQAIDWVADNFKEYGYTMICTDGWGTDFSMTPQG